MPNINFLDGLNGPRFKYREISLPLPPAEPKPEIKIQPRPKKNWKPFVFLVIIASIITIAFSTNVMFSSSSLLNNLTGLKSSESKTGLWGQFKRLFGIEEKLLQGEAGDRINILLLGQGGAGHEGPYLTDTIILLSIKPSTGQVAAISIPRDLYVPLPRNGWRKINYANSYGEVELNGQGGETASQVVSETFNLPIHYYIRVDFTGFQKVVEDLGGVNVYVEKDFTDSQYPTENFGYQTISFNKGWQKMAGETALKFARSRHGNNGEGSDFARAKRQQKIIIAIKNKAFSLGSLFRPDKLIKAAGDLNDHFKTNLKVWEMLRLTKFAQSIDLNQIVTRVLDDSPNGPLVSFITEDGAFVLKTKTNDFSELAFITANIFSNPSEAAIAKNNEAAQKQQELLDKVENEGYAKIIVQNGTLGPGLAQKTADYLAGLNFQITQFGNAPIQNYEKTILYDFTDGKKKAALEYLSQELNARLDSDSLKIENGDWKTINPQTPAEDNSASIGRSEDTPTADFVLIIGSNYAEPAPPQKLELPAPAASTSTSTTSEVSTSTNSNIETTTKPTL